MPRPRSMKAFAARLRRRMSLSMSQRSRCTPDRCDAAHRPSLRHLPRPVSVCSVYSVVTFSGFCKNASPAKIRDPKTIKYHIRS